MKYDDSENGSDSLALSFMGFAWSLCLHFPPTVDSKSVISMP